MFVKSAASRVTLSKGGMMDKPRDQAVKPRKCPICQGTGFVRGEVCFCITGKNPENMPDLPDGWADIFGDIFHHKGDERGRK
jgi:hypothetical protein